MQPNFWRGKRVLLTGHSGLKGSWLALWLQSLGAEVIGYALDPPTEPSLFRVANVGEGMVSLVGDVRNLDALRKVFSEHRPQIVFHLAAQSLVRISYVEPVETYTINIIGTVNVLEAVRHANDVRAVVNVTSDKCYDNREWVWGYRENEPMGGRDPYSSSKGCAELVTAAYRTSFFSPLALKTHGVAVATARAGNVIAGGDWARDRLVPDIMRAIEETRPVVIRSPTAVRPWQHVLDPLSGYLNLAERLWNQGADFAEGWNFGPNDEDIKSVGWIVERLIQEWGDGASWELDKTEHPHEAHNLKLDSSKARMKLGWKPLWNLETALKSIVDWYRAYYSRANMRDVVLDQIANYNSSGKS